MNSTSKKAAKAIGAICVVCLAVLLTGCPSTKPGPLMSHQKVEDSRIIYTVKGASETATLRKFIKTISVEASKTESGLLEVNAVFHNIRSKDLWVDVMTVFLDENGREIEKTNWQNVQFFTGVDQTFRQTSIRESATDFCIYLREPDISLRRR